MLFGPLEEQKREETQGAGKKKQITAGPAGTRPHAKYKREESRKRKNGCISGGGSSGNGKRRGSDGHWECQKALANPNKRGVNLHYTSK